MDEWKHRTQDEIIHDGRSLREILNSHQEWLKSAGKKGSRADLRGADLRWSDLVRTDLSGINLSGANLNEVYAFAVNLYSAVLERAELLRADLRSANLSYAKLNGAALCSADLSDAKLERTDLNSANMSMSTLHGAEVRGANLRGTVLSKANLRWAILFQSELSEANLTEAKFGGVVIGDCDLSNVIGLETIQHFGPSSIGVDTIVRSQGKIPESFLRDAGVPDIWIAYARSLVGKPIEFYSCFISHSSQDKDFSERLYADLQAKSVRCWYFPEDATWGKSVWGEIDRGIRMYDKLVVVCSEHSLNSGPVIREIERALQREDNEKKEILFPIRTDDYLFDKWDHPRKADVIAKVVGDFRGWKDHEQYKENFDKLLKALNRPAPNRS